MTHTFQADRAKQPLPSLRNGRGRTRTLHAEKRRQKIKHEIKRVVAWIFWSML